MIKQNTKEKIGREAIYCFEIFGTFETKFYLLGDPVSLSIKTCPWNVVFYNIVVDLFQEAPQFRAALLKS